MPHPQRVVKEFIRNTHVLSGVVREALVPELLSAAGAGNLTFEQMNVLKLIDTHGEHTLNLLAKFLAVTSPAASVMVDKLVKLNYVSRKENPDDRREVLIAVTEHGKRLVGRFGELSNSRFTKFLHKLTEDEIAVFNLVIHRFARDLLKTSEQKTSLCLQCGAFDTGGCLIPDIKGICHYLPAAKDLMK